MCIIILFLIILLIYICIILKKKSICSYFDNDDDNDDNMDEILPGLWLGNIKSAYNINKLKKNNIKYIFNISTEIPNFYENDNYFKYYKFKVNDSLLDRDINLMSENLSNLVKKLAEAINNKDGNVLVHCFAGRQRSAILVAAYLVYKYKMNPREAYDFILKKRPEAFHYNMSINFNKSLNKYYNELNI